MSLILDALRKSEAERRRAQVPDLFAQTELAAPAAPHVRRGGWRWAAAGVLAVAAVAWGLSAWWPAPAPSLSRSSPGRHAPEAAPAPRTAPAAARPAAPVTAPPPARAIAATPTPSAPAAPDAARVPGPAAVEAGRPPASIAAPAPPAAALVHAPPPPVPEVPDSRPRQDDASAVAPPQADDTLRLADLGAEARKQLPPLKLSMHLWDSDPARRFVILDGQRLGEGDRIGEAVIEQITRDGVVLAWNGQRLRLSLP